MAKEKVEAKKRVTYVAFNREYGVQVARPNGTFVKYIEEDAPGRSHSSTFSAIGISDIEMTDEELIVTLKTGIKRHFPKTSLSDYTVE